MDRCHNCGQELIEIDNRGQRLTRNLQSVDGRRREGLDTAI